MMCTLDVCLWLSLGDRIANDLLNLFATLLHSKSTAGLSDTNVGHLVLHRLMAPLVQYALQESLARHNDLDAPSLRTKYRRYVAMRDK